MDKLRRKTDDELAEQGRALAGVRDVLTEHGVSPVVTGGTFLGAVRDGGFIPWDWDAEFSVLYEQVERSGPTIATHLRAAGFELGRVRFGKRRWKIEVLANGFLIEVRAWYRDGDLRRREMFCIPGRYLDDLGRCELAGATYACPKDADGYLTYVYGDWRTPQRSADKRQYLAESFYDARQSPDRFMGRLYRRMRKVRDWVDDVFRR